LTIAAIGAVLTLAGLVAALWHMAWWIGGVLLVMAALSAGLVVAVFAHAQPRESEWEKSLKQRGHRTASDGHAESQCEIR